MSEHRAPRRSGRTAIVAAALLAGSALCLGAQQPGASVAAAYRAEMQRADQAIADEVRAHGALASNLDYLTTHIGGRLTGTQQMEDAARWARERFTRYGLDAHLETMTIAHAWYRGRDTAALISPIERPVDVRSYGWSKATAGELTAPVVWLEDSAPETIAANRTRIAGAIVLIGKPADLLQPIAGAENAYDAVVPLPHGVPAPTPPTGITRELITAGPGVVLTDSGKADTLFSMTSAGVNFEPSEIPMAFITHEDYSLIYRLARDGAVRMSVHLTGTFSAGGQPASIVVAEIKGSEQPGERVIVGAHLDSWDLGQGALDNGTGAMAVLEAARALQALGWTPRRTLTFMLFPGEEQGLRGSRWYVQQHAGDMAAVDAMLVHDTGTGRVLSIALQGLFDTGPLVTRVYDPLQTVFDLQPMTNRAFGGSDHVPFRDAGVPAYFCVQKPAQYGAAHHSQTDTFDKVLPDDASQGAAVLAAWMWNVSQLAERLPHQRF